MTTQRQRKSNKRNAQHSTGPTPSGQRNSRKNALKHGILSPQLFLSDENPADFDTLCSELAEALQPQDALQRTFVTKIAMDLWRQRRLDRAEAASIELERQQKLLEAIPESNGDDPASQTPQRPFDVQSFKKMYPSAAFDKEFMEEFPKLLPRRAELTAEDVTELAPGIMLRYILASAIDNPATTQDILQDPMTFLQELPSDFLENKQLPFWDWAIKELVKIQKRYAEPEIPQEELIKMANSAPIHNTLISRYQTMLNNQLNKDLKTYDQLQQASAKKPSVIEGTLSSTSDRVDASVKAPQKRLNGSADPKQ